MPSYVCAHCGKSSSMQGHYVRFNEEVDGEDVWGFHCDPENNGKTYGSGTWKRTVRAPRIVRTDTSSWTGRGRWGLMPSHTATRHQMVTRWYFAWVTPSNRVFHWVDDRARTKAVCGAPNRGWRKVLDLRGDDLNATAKAKECARCDEAWASESVTSRATFQTTQSDEQGGAPDGR